MRYDIDVFLVEGRQARFSYTFSLDADGLDQAKERSRRKLARSELSLRTLSVRSGEPCKLLAYVRKDKR